MPPHTKSPADATAVHRHKTALARAGLAVGVLAAPAAGTVAVGAGPDGRRPGGAVAAAIGRGAGMAQQSLRLR